MLHSRISIFGRIKHDPERQCWYLRNKNELGVRLIPLSENPCVCKVDLGEYPIQLWQHMATIASRMGMSAAMHKPYEVPPSPSLALLQSQFWLSKYRSAKCTCMKVPQPGQGAVSPNGDSTCLGRAGLMFTSNASPSFNFQPMVNLWHR